MRDLEPVTEEGRHKMAETYEPGTRLRHTRDGRTGLVVEAGTAEAPGGVAIPQYLIDPDDAKMGYAWWPASRVEAVEQLAPYGERLTLAQHPTPWSVWGYEVRDAAGHRVASCDLGSDAAEFIARLVNEHVMGDSARPVEMLAEDGQ